MESGDGDVNREKENREVTVKEKKKDVETKY
jgi:hypothetical protein